MSPYTPAVLVSLVPQPVVAEDLGVKVVCLERRVVDVRGPGSLKEEEAVMVHELVSPVESKEDGHVDALLVVNQFAGVEVEVFAVELVALGVVGYAHAEVTELVNGCWSLLETCKGVLGAVVFFGLAGC
jgi:hypothetical protein